MEITIRHSLPLLIGQMQMISFSLKLKENLQDHLVFLESLLLQPNSLLSKQISLKIYLTKKIHLRKFSKKIDLIGLIDLIEPTLGVINLTQFLLALLKLKKLKTL